MDTIPVYFQWISVSPDKRQWKPSMPVFNPLEIRIQVNVPADPEYFVVTETTVRGVILTPKGMRYCIDELEKVMTDNQDNTNITQDQNNDDEWEKSDNQQDDEWEK